MKHQKNIGIWLIIISWITYVVWGIYGVNTKIAKWYCGDMYNVEPDEALRAQGILTERACWFDSDMYIMAFVICLTLLWIYLIAFNKKK